MQHGPDQVGGDRMATSTSNGNARISGELVPAEYIGGSGGGDGGGDSGGGDDDGSGRYNVD